MKNLFKNYFTVTFGTGLSRGLSFLTTLILARAMGAHSFGVFSLFFTVTMLVWQFPSIIDFVYVRYAKAETNEERPDIIRTAFLMKASICLVLLLGAYPCGIFLADYVFKKPEMSLYLCAGIVSGVFLSIFTTLSGIYLARERFDLYSLINIFFYAIVFVVIAALAISKQPLTPFITALIYAVSAAATGAIAVFYLYLKIKPLFPVKAKLLSDMLGFGKWLLGVSLMDIILQRIDILFLARMSTYEELGIYSASVRIAMLATILTSSATAIFMPRGCESLNSKRQLKKYFKESFVIAGILSAFILALILLSPLIIRALFGPQYVGSLLTSRLLLLEAVFILFYTPFSFLYYANGDTGKIFMLSAVKLAITILCLALLVPLLGSAGAALSIALSSFLTLALIVLMSIKLIKTHAFPIAIKADEELMNV